MAIIPAKHRGRLYEAQGGKRINKFGLLFNKSFMVKKLVLMGQKNPPKNLRRIFIGDD